MSAPLSIDEVPPARRILDTPPDPAFERIVHLAAAALKTPIAVVSFVDRDRRWHQARVGLPTGEIPPTDPFCAHALLGRDVLVVRDAAADPRFAASPHVAGEPGIRFYAGAPLPGPDGQPLGTLCVLDYQPRRFGERERNLLSGLAAVVADEIALRAEVAARQHAESSLQAQQQTVADLHETVERHVAIRTVELTRLNEALHSEISRRELADQARRRSEQRFRQLFNQASDAAMVHDLNGRLVDVNDVACTSLGYTRDELLTMGVPDFELTHDPAEGFKFWRELEPGSVDKFEGCHRRKDGSTFPVEIHVSVLDTTEGRHLLALIRDITDRRRAEELLRARARQQEAIARLGTRALSGGGVDELLRAAVVLVGDTLGVENCRVHEHLPARGEFVVRASLDPSGDDVGTVVSGDGVAFSAGYVLHHGQPVIMDLETESRFTPPPALRLDGFRCALCVPVGGSTPGEPRYGVLGAAARGRRTFTEDDMFFVQSVANVLAAAIARQRQEDHLRAVEARYRRIAANTPGVVYQFLLRADGTVAIPFISEGCRTLYGWEAHQMQRTPGLMLDSVHPEDRAGFLEAMHAAKMQLTPLHWQGRHLLPGGEVRWMRVDSRPERLPDGGVICDGIIIDVTEQRQRQEALRQSEERFRLAILQSPFPIMLHASDGEIVKLNHAWTRLTGYREEDLRTMEDWLTRAYRSEEDREEVRASLVDFDQRDDPLERPGRRILCADGSERIWDFTRANLDRLPDGRCLHMETAVDVTERYQGEIALRAAKDEAERANRAKSAFLSRMSHELRTPLNAILGFGQLLELSALDKQDATSLGYILKGGRHLLALIDEVLDLSRAETGDLNLLRRDVNVAALAQECVGLVARMAQARGITCRVDVPGDVSLWADEQRLRQTLLNLLSNAIKYNHTGGEVLLSIGESSPPGSLRIMVSDTGPGISAEGMSRLFVPFERLEQEYGEAEGTGLGLVISRRIAEAMGGTLGVESEPGRGSTFWIELPLAADPAAPSPAAAPPARPSAARATAAADATLLYIEDNVSNLQVVKALLANSRPRWRFLSARDGLEGLDLARRSLPDLVLLDLQLPGMKGDAVLTELRGDPLTHGIPVILLSADATPLSRERLLAGGANDYITKPFQVDHLLKTLDRMLLQAAANQQN